MSIRNLRLRYSSTASFYCDLPDQSIDPIEQLYNNKIRDRGIQNSKESIASIHRALNCHFNARSLVLIILREEI